jgi:hypothetical protein
MQEKGIVTIHQSLRNKLLRAKFELGSMLGHHPFLFYLWRKLFRPETAGRLLSSHTEIVIEGFPRSGNTFAVAAFRLAQNRPVAIAHHSHKIVQVARAVEGGIPTLVVIRHPADAVVSLVIRYPFLTIPQALNNYIRYYKGISQYRQGFVLSQFEDIVSDFGNEIRKVNKKFGTAFLPFEHTEENVKQSFLLIEKMHRESIGHDRIVETAIARPSSHRSELKKELKKSLQQQRIRDVLDEAEKFYLSFAH